MKASELQVGSKIALREASEVGVYTLVKKDYNTGKAMLWRDDSIGSVQWRTSAASTASANTYQGSNLDTYLQNTWYPSLPQATKDVLTPLSYPVGSSNSSGSQTYISRNAATVSMTEIGGTVDSGFYGSVLSSYTFETSYAYWTREPQYNDVNVRYIYSYTGGSLRVSGPATNSWAVRPTVGIDVSSTSQIEATWDGESAVYWLSIQSTSSVPTAPAALYLNGGPYNYGEVEPGASFTLSWDASTSSSVIGYTVYYKDTGDTTYTAVGTFTSLSTTVYAPDSYSTTRTFYVRAISSDGYASDYSTATRYVTTKAAPASSGVTAPTSLYFQGYTGNVPDAELNTQYILLWSGATGSISGYEVYRSTTPDGYSLWYTVSSDSSGIAITTPNTNSTTWSFMVRAVGTDGSYSSFAGPISITTKAAQVFTNYGISYYNGTQWHHPTPKYYNGTSWIIPTMWYYDGSDWLPIPPRPKCSATVEDVSGAMYGFEINDNGYHESQNKGVGSSYALCKVKIVTDGTQAVYVDCINYAESTYDYGILSKIDTALSLSIGADSTDKVQHTFSGSHSASVQTVDYGVLSAGEYYIYIKYIKDSRDDYNNDSLQFKVRFV